MKVKDLMKFNPEAEILILTGINERGVIQTEAVGNAANFWHDIPAMNIDPTVFIVSEGLKNHVRGIIKATKYKVFPPSPSK